MLTWSVLAEVHIQWLTLCFFALAVHVIRDCGQDVNLLQTPTEVVLHRATDVEDTARIEAQWLIVHPGGRMSHDAKGTKQCNRIRFCACGAH